MEILLHPGNWIALLTLTFLEIVLGIDNIIFISIVSDRLTAGKQPLARNTGLLLAMGMRILLLIGITYIIQFSQPLLTIADFSLSIRDLILFSGGSFLLIKSILEIHHKMEDENHDIQVKQKTGILSVVLQIMVLDMVFSFDSILTAIGLTDKLLLMIIAVVISIFLMMAFSGTIARFINGHPTLQVLALSFLILIGFMLVLDALHYHVPKGYIYFAVFFSLCVELVNMRVRKRSKAEST
jgi:predicted tellurium resistance membrane protein TerC